MDGRMKASHDVETFEEAMSAVRAVTPSSLRREVEASLGVLETAILAGGMEAAAASTAAKLGRRSLAKVWLAGVRLPLLRSGGGDAAAWASRVLPEDLADPGRALPSLRDAIAGLDRGASLHAHFVVAERFLLAAAWMQGAFDRTLAGAFRVDRSGWRDVGDPIRFLGVGFDKRMKSFAKAFVGAFGEANGSNEATLDLAGLVESPGFRPEAWPSLDGFRSRCRERRYLRWSDAARDLREGVARRLAEALVGARNDVERHVPDASSLELVGNDRGGDRGRVTVEISGRATKVVVDLRYDPSDVRVVARVEDRGRGGPWPSESLMRIPEQGGAKWAAFASGPAEAFVVPLGRTGDRPPEELDAFLAWPAPRGMVLHVAAAGDPDRQAYLAARGFAWGERRGEGFMTGEARRSPPGGPRTPSRAPWRPPPGCG